MPHFEISVNGGDPIVRRLNSNLRICNHNGKFYWAPSKSKLSAKTLETLQPEDTLHLYFELSFLHIRALAKLEHETLKSLSKIVIIEDHALGIIYVHDERYVKLVVNALREDLSLINITPPQ